MNPKGETALDLVSKDMDSQLQRVYQNIGQAMNREFDISRLQKVRPQIASLLKQNMARTSEDNPTPE